MKNLTLTGQILFAVAIVGFGILCFGFVDSVHQLQPINELLSEGTFLYVALAILTGILLIAAGLAIVTGIKISLLTSVLTVFFLLWIVFLQIPSAFIDPSLLRSPWWVRTFETLALTGGALVLAGMTSQPKRKRWIRIGRVFFGISLPVFGVLHFIYAEFTATIVPSWYPWPLFLVYLTGLGNIAAGIALTSGILPRLAAIFTGVMYGIYALTLHIPRSVSTYIPELFMDDPAALASARAGLTSLFVAIGMWATAWIVAGSLAKKDSMTYPDSDSPEKIHDKTVP